eukprot:102725-Heterocapsa_arctica.AAC.1
MARLAHQGAKDHALARQVHQGHGHHAQAANRPLPPRRQGPGHRPREARARNPDGDPRVGDGVRPARRLRPELLRAPVA